MAEKVLILSHFSRPPPQTKRGQRSIPPLEPLLPRRPSGTVARASACPSGQNAETKFSFPFRRKKSVARKKEIVKKILLEA